MRRKSLFATFALAISLLATGCGANGSKSSKLQLLYFGKPRNDIVETSNRLVKLPNRLNEEEPNDKNYEIDYYNGIDLEAHVKNVDRLAFLDIVVYSASTGKKYVFNDGNGEYRVESSTVLSDDVWITKLRFSWIDWNLIAKETDNCFFDSYLEIESINFLNISGSVAQTNISKSNVRRVNIRAYSQNGKDHSWTDLSFKNPTCTQYGGFARRCTVCNKEDLYYSFDTLPPTKHFWSDWEIVKQAGCMLTGSKRRECSICHEVQVRTIPSHSWEYTFEHKTAGVLARNDKVTRVCSICQKQETFDFPYFPSLTEFVIPSDITSISEQAFEYCENIAAVTIPSRVTSIGDEAFYACMSLMDVYFESSTPPELGIEVFGNTWYMEDFVVHVPCEYSDIYEAIYSPMWDAFAMRLDGHKVLEWTLEKTPNCGDYGRATGICSLCNQSVTKHLEATNDHKWSDTIQDIEATCDKYGGKGYVCSICGATDLVEVDWNKSPLGHEMKDITIHNFVPGTIQSGDIVLGSCARCNLALYEELPHLDTAISLVIPNSINTIASGAFEGSNGLISVTIPASVTSIGERAFASCSNLKSVYFESQTPPQLGADVFAGSSGNSRFAIYVPCDSADTYKTVEANSWSSVAKYIVGDHNYGEWVVTKNPADCSEQGERERVCSYCGHKDSETFTLPHAWTEWAMNDETNKYERECTVCGEKQTRSTSLDAVTNSDGKVVTFTYDQNNPSKYYESIKISDGTIISGSIGSDGKMASTTTDIKWHLPVYDVGEAVIQLSMKMSNRSHESQTFVPSAYSILVNGIEMPLLFLTGQTYGEIGLTTETQYFSFARYDVTAADANAGEIEIEFVHKVSSYRLLFTEDLRLAYL